jgi:ubiquinone biosynthesis protein UbiJ
VAPTSLFSIERQGDRWAVSSDREVLILTRTRREARRLARLAAEALGEELRLPVRPPEPRSFAEDE